MADLNLNPNITYNVKVRIGVRSRGIEQEHTFTYRSPDGRAPKLDDVLLDLRTACAQVMGVRTSDTYIVDCAFIPA